MPRISYTTCPGLVTNTNDVNAPPGSLRMANGVVIRKQNLIEHRRGHRQYDKTGYQGTPYGIFIYGGLVFVSLSSGDSSQTYVEDGSGTFSAASGTLLLPPASTVSLSDHNRFAEYNGTGYVTTKTGIARIDAYNSAFQPAGIPRCLDVQLTLSGAASVFTAANQVAAYRVTFGLQDANLNVMTGPPSGRATITSTGSGGVVVKALIPKQIYSSSVLTQHYYQVWRTATSNAGADPGDECQLVYQSQLTSTDGSNKYVQFTDISPDSMRGASLYTNASQFGIAQSNNPPPLSADIALFKGTMFYSRTTSKHRARTTMLGIPFQWGISSIAINTPAAGKSTVQLSGSPDLTGVSYGMLLPIIGSVGASNDGTWTIANYSDADYTNGVSNTLKRIVVPQVMIAQAGAGGTAMSGSLTVGADTYYPIYGTESITPGSLFYTVTTSGTVSQNVANTCTSLLRVVNQSSTSVYGSYDSGPDDGPGQMVFEEQNVGGSSFSVSGAGKEFVSTWSPNLAIATVSKNDSRSNRVYYSRPGQPDSVPLGNYFDIGSQSSPAPGAPAGSATKIFRILALRNALLVFKSDGLFLITGDGSGSWSVTPFDSTIQVLSENMVCVMRNTAYAMCSRGVARITETGSASFISYPIANIASGAVAASRSGYVSANEADGVIYFAIGSQDVDTLIYSVETNAWTGGSGASGDFTYQGPSVYSNATNQLYYLIPSGSVHAEQRGALTPGSVKYMRGDVFEPGDATYVTISSSNSGAKTVTTSGVPGWAIVGDILKSNATEDSNYWVVSNVSGGTLTLTALNANSVFNFANGLAFLFAPISVTVLWNPMAPEDAVTQKRINEIDVSFANIDEIDTNGISRTQSLWPQISTCDVSIFSDVDSAVQTQSQQPVISRLLRIQPPLSMLRHGKLFIGFKHPSTAGSSMVGALERFAINALSIDVDSLTSASPLQ